VVIDQRYLIPRAPSSILVDGELKEWKDLRLRSGAEPTVVGPAESWTGDADASIAFDVARDNQFLYFAARVLDDAVRPEADAVEVRLDARPSAARSEDSRLVEGAYRFRLAAPDGSDGSSLRVRSYGGTNGRPSATVAGRRSDAGYDVELAVPLEIIEQQQGPDWPSIQLSIALVDVDEPGQAASRLLWRGTTDFDRRNTNFGHFVRTD
jgi:hypothetical protein